MPVPVLTSTNSAAASTEISAPGLASSAFKRRVAIVNTDVNALCVRIGAAATTSAYNVRIVQNGYWESPTEIEGVIYGIWEADGSGAALVTEY